MTSADLALVSCSDTLGRRFIGIPPCAALACAVVANRESEQAEHGGYPESASAQRIALPVQGHHGPSRERAHEKHGTKPGAGLSLAAEIKKSRESIAHGTPVAA